MSSQTVETDSHFQGLLAWVNSLELASGPSTDLDSLIVGRAIAEALQAIDENYFTDSWKSTLKLAEPGVENWRVHASSLRQIFKKLLDYYESELRFPVNETFTHPDVNKLAQDKSKEDMVRLLQLVVCAAFKCRQQEVFVEAVMSMENYTQSAVMSAIKNVSSEASGVDSQSSHNQEDNEDELSFVRQELVESQRRCSELDNQLTTLSEHNQHLTAEHERLMSRLNEENNPDDPNSAAGRKLASLTMQNEQLRQSLHDNENGNSDLIAKLEAYNAENEELKLRINELVETETKFRQLSDDNDELQMKLDKMKQTEALLETYKRRLDEQADLKSQLKILEEKNASYMKSEIALEEEQRKNNALKMQYDSLKKGKQELEATVMSETKRADKAKQKEKLKTVEDEKKRLTADNREMKEKLDLNTGDLISLHKRLNSELQRRQGVVNETGTNIMNRSFKKKGGTSASSSPSKKRKPDEGSTDNADESHEGDTEEEARRKNYSHSHPFSFKEPIPPWLASCEDVPGGASVLLQNSANALLNESFMPASGELSERMTRLEIENEQLKATSVPQEDYDLLKEQLEDMEKRKIDLETDTRVSHSKILELESRIEELNGISENNQSKDDSRLTKLHQDSETKGMEVTRLTKKVSELEKLVHDKDKLMSDAMKNCEEWESKHKQLESQYKTHMEKACTVIATLEKNAGGRYSRTSSTVSMSDAPEAIKKEMERKDKEIAKLQDEIEKMRILAEQEQRLMTTAWYDKAVELQRSAGAERMANLGSDRTPDSFLNQQRAVTTRKGGNANNNNNNNLNSSNNSGNQSFFRR